MVLCNKNHHISRTLISPFYIHFSPHSVVCKCYSIYLIILTSYLLPVVKHLKHSCIMVGNHIQHHLNCFVVAFLNLTDENEVTLILKITFILFWKASGLCQWLSWYFSKKQLLPVLKGNVVVTSSIRNYIRVQTSPVTTTKGADLTLSLPSAHHKTVC
jgi:hypothetical protein